jgi:hypothetical protein
LGITCFRINVGLQLGFFKRQARKYYTNASPARRVLACKLDPLALQDVPDYNEACPESTRKLDGLDCTMEEFPSDECRRVDGPWVDGRGSHHADVAKRAFSVGQKDENESAWVDGPDISEMGGRAISCVASARSLNGGSDLVNAARPDTNTPRAARGPLLDVMIGSRWKLKGLRKTEFNGRLCRLLDVRDTVAKMTFVDDISGIKYRVNCSQLVHPDDYAWKPTETEEQLFARVRAQKEFDRLGRIY